MYFEENLEIKLATIWTDEKAEVGRVREEKRREERRSEKRKSQARRQKMQVHEKVAKSRNTVFFQWFVPPEGQKVGSLKRRVRSRREMKNCAPLWREAHFEVKMYKAHQRSSKHHMFVPLLDVEASFCAAGARDSPPCQK